MNRRAGTIVSMPLMPALCLSLLAGCGSSNPPCPSSKPMEYVVTTSEDGQKSLSPVLPSDRKRRAPELEAIEMVVASGERLQISSTGQVLEIVDGEAREVRLSRRRRALIQQAFLAEPRDMFGWLSYVPPSLVEVRVGMRYAGQWQLRPTYRRCGPVSSDPCWWETRETNAFADKIVRLAGYRPAFQCPRRSVFASTMERNL